MFYISDDRQKIQIPRVEELLKQSYWAGPREIRSLPQTIENSLCFGVYLKENDLQIAFGRVITDYTTAYYLCDVIVDEKYRSQGIGKALIKRIVTDKRLTPLKGMLKTSEAHGLYEKYGFHKADADRFMYRQPE